MPFKDLTKFSIQTKEFYQSIPLKQNIKKKTQKKKKLDGDLLQLNIAFGTLPKMTKCTKIYQKIEIYCYSTSATKPDPNRQYYYRTTSMRLTGMQTI